MSSFLSKMAVAPFLLSPSERGIEINVSSLRRRWLRFGLEASSKVRVGDKKGGGDRSERT